MKTDYSKTLRIAIVIALIFAIIVIVTGTLAIPVVMSLKFSWYWMFLYAGYLLIALFIALYVTNNSGGDKKQ